MLQINVVEYKNTFFFLGKTPAVNGHGTRSQLDNQTGLIFALYYAKKIQVFV